MTKINKIILLIGFLSAWTANVLADRIETEAITFSNTVEIVGELNVSYIYATGIYYQVGSSIVTQGFEGLERNTTITTNITYPDGWTASNFIMRGSGAGWPIVGAGSNYMYLLTTNYTGFSGSELMSWVKSPLYEDGVSQVTFVQKLRLSVATTNRIDVRISTDNASWEKIGEFWTLPSGVLSTCTSIVNRRGPIYLQLCYSNQAGANLAAGIDDITITKYDTDQAVTMHQMNLTNTAFFRKDGSTTIDGDILFSQSNRFSIGSQANPASNVWIGTNSVHFVKNDGTVETLNAGDVANAKTSYGWGDWEPSYTILSSSESDTRTLLGRAIDDIYQLKWEMIVNNSMSRSLMADGYLDGFIDQNGVNINAGSNYTYTAGSSSYDWTYTEGDPLPEVPDLVWWKLNESAASTAVQDFSAGEHAGTASINSSAFTSPGKINNSFNFDGRGYVEAVGYKGILGSQPRTHTFWFRGTNTTSSDWVTILRYGTTDQGQGIEIGLSPAGVWGAANERAMHVTRMNGSARVYNVNVTDGNWHFMCFPISNEWYEAWMDMVFYERMTGGYTINTASGEDMILGSTRPASAQWSGQIDDFRTYNRFLTTQEMYAIWNSGNGTESATGDPSGGNMALYSTNPPGLSFVATNVKVMAWAQGATNFTVSVSGDKGTNWTAMPWVSVQQESTLTNIFSSATNAPTTPSSNLWWKAESFGNTTGSLHGIAIQGR